MQRAQNGWFLFQSQLFLIIVSFEYMTYLIGSLIVQLQIVNFLNE
jgi:hypothetical protein